MRERYQPRDTTPRAGVTRGTAPRSAPRTAARRTAPRVSAPTAGAGTATPTPRLTSRVGAPRLGTTRLAAPLTVGAGRAGFTRNAATYGTYGYRWGTVRAGCSPIWNGYWGWNWGWRNGCSLYRPFGFRWSYGWGLCGWGGLGWSPLSWGFCALSPYAAWQTNYWNSCYSSAYWNNWCTPYSLSSSYWWYPNGVYCPTYLTVPGSAVVVSSPTGFLDTGSSAPVVDGGAGAARAGEVPPPDDTSPAGLAQKYVELGDFYFEAGRYDDAAEAYAKARNHLPDDASIHFVMADAVFANGDYHYAAFLIAEAVRLQPDIVSADVDKRDFYGVAGDFEAQLLALERYCADKPYDAWAQLLLGYNLRFSGRSERALLAFRKVLELDRGNVTAKAFVDDLESRRAAPAAGADEKRDR